MAKKQATVVVRMEDPKAKAKPDLSYGGSSLSVGVDNDTDGHPVKLSLVVEVELPEATAKNLLQQDLLAATRIVGEAKKYLADREEFFKDQIRIRMSTKGCKQEAGFLTGELSAQNKKDFEWKEFAIKQLTKLIQQKEKCGKKRAEVLARDAAKKAYDKASIKVTKPKVSVKGVKLDA